jgi:nucleotide-binding universal stress UspA family protein
LIPQSPPPAQGLITAFKRDGRLYQRVDHSAYLAYTIDGEDKVMRIQRVLVPLDQSKLAEAALKYACALLRSPGGLTLLTVIEPPTFIARDYYDVPTAPGSFISSIDFSASPYAQQAQNHAHQYLNRIALQLRSPEVQVDAQVLVGSPAERILELAEAQQVDAIVMSTHGRSGIGQWVFGSVAQKVLSAAVCPVFIIPQSIFHTEAHV